MKEWITVYRQPPNKPGKQTFVDVMLRGEDITVDHLRKWNIDPDSTVDLKLVQSWRDTKPKYWLVVVNEEPR